MNSNPYSVVSIRNLMIIFKKENGKKLDKMRGKNEKKNKLFVDIRLLRICYLSIYNTKNYGQFDRLETSGNRSNEKIERKK